LPPPSRYWTCCSLGKCYFPGRGLTLTCLGLRLAPGLWYSSLIMGNGVLRGEPSLGVARTKWDEPWRCLADLALHSGLPGSLGL
jgi:hypothetical protein